MASKMKARVRYVVQDGREGYAIESKVDGEWGLDSWFPLVKKEGVAETDFVHWTLLHRLSEVQKMGYDIQILQ